MAFAAVLLAAATLAAASGADSEVQVGPAGSVSLMRRAARPHVAAPGRAGPTGAIAGLVEPLDEGGRAEASLLQGGGAGGAQSAAALSGGSAVVATVRAHGANASGALLTGWHTESSPGNLLALNISDGALHGNEWGHGSTIALIGGNSGKFCADEGHMIKCNRNAIGTWEKFYVHSAGGGKWALRGGRHKKWCADEGSRIRCNRNLVGGWEKFTIGGSGTARTLRGGRQNKLCADEKDRGMKCNRNRVGAWERFEFEYPIVASLALVSGKTPLDTGENSTRGSDEQEVTVDSQVALCQPKSTKTGDAGYPDAYRGWYDVQGCGHCLDYCRWVGSGGSGGDPTKQLSNGKGGWWSCRLAGTDVTYTGKSDFLSWPYSKCTGEGARKVVTCSASGSITNNKPENKRAYSSVWGNNVIGTGHARSALDSVQAWSSRWNSFRHWMQLDLGASVTVSGVVTQGRANWNQWVTRYRVAISEDGGVWQHVGDMTGNRDRSSKVKGMFPSPRLARYIRIKPRGWHKHMSMRAAALTCTADSSLVEPSSDATAARLDAGLAQERDTEEDEDEEPANIITRSASELAQYAEDVVGSRMSNAMEPAQNSEAGPELN